MSYSVRPLVNAEVLARVETFLSELRKELRLPGLAVSIVSAGRVCYSAGFGSAGDSRPVTEETPFIIGSLSKSFTALAVMQLVEMGKLHLDDSVSVYLPWFQVAGSIAAGSITLRSLLNHTSGFSTYDGRVLLSGRGGNTLEQSVRDLARVKLSSVPGVKYAYSNLNYLVLSLLIEVASGESYPDYIQRHIFDSLGMKQSFTSYEKAASSLSQGYRWWYGFPLAYDAPYLVDGQGAAFLISSAADMARWLLLHLDGSLDGVRLVSPAGMDSLHRGTVPTKRPGSVAAMGWRVEEMRGESVLRHGGEVSNFRADMVLVPGRNLGVVVLANCNNGLVAQLGLDQIAMWIVRLLLGLPLPRKGLTLSRFYGGVGIGVGVVTLLQVGIWPYVALSGRPGLLLWALLVLDLLWPLLLLWKVPRWANMPWRGLKLYVPDLYSWLTTILVLAVAFNLVFVAVWLLR